MHAEWPSLLILIVELSNGDVLSRLNKSLCAALFGSVIPAPEGSCWDCGTLRNANVCGLRGEKITLIMCGWMDRMVAIERGERVWTDRGLYYRGRALPLRL